MNIQETITALDKLFVQATQGEWEWVTWDKSMTQLSVKGKELEEVILACSRCKACYDRDAICFWPSEADQKLIQALHNSWEELRSYIETLRAQAEEKERTIKLYQKLYRQSCDRYDELSRVPLAERQKRQVTHLKRQFESLRKKLKQVRSAAQEFMKHERFSNFQMLRDEVQKLRLENEVLRKQLSPWNALMAVLNEFRTGDEDLSSADAYLNVYSKMQAENKGLRLRIQQLEQEVAP